MEKAQPRKAPIKSPRIQVSVSGPAYELIQQLADLQGTSMSKVIGGLIDASYPALVRLANILQITQTAQVHMQDSLRDRLGDIASESDRELQAAFDLLEELERVLGPLTSNTGVASSETRILP